MKGATISFIASRSSSPSNRDFSGAASPGYTPSVKTGQSGSVRDGGGWSPSAKSFESFSSNGHEKDLHSMAATIVKKDSEIRSLRNHVEDLHKKLDDAMEHSKAERRTIVMEMESQKKEFNDAKEEMVNKYSEAVEDASREWQLVKKLLQQMKTGKSNVEVRDQQHNALLYFFSHNHVGRVPQLTNAVRAKEMARLDFAEKKGREEFVKYNRELTTIRTAMSNTLAKAEAPDIQLPKRRQYTSQYNKLAKKEAKTIVLSHKVCHSSKLDC